MKKEEVIKVIGEENWEEFSKFMRGQTVGLNDDGTIDYYECDVKKYKKLKASNRLIKWWEKNNKS